MTVVSPVEAGVLEGRVSAASFLRRSPLAARRGELAARRVEGARGVRLAEEAFLTQVNVRVDPESAARERIERTLGLALPLPELAPLPLPELALLPFPVGLPIPQKRCRAYRQMVS